MVSADFTNNSDKLKFLVFTVNKMYFNAFNQIFFGR